MRVKPAQVLFLRKYRRDSLVTFTLNGVEFTKITLKYSWLLSRTLMSPFCLDLSLNLSTSTVSRVQAKCLHKLVCRGNRHFEFRRGRKVQKVERRVYVKPATVSKNGTDILTVDRYNTTKTTASTTKELIERVSMFENELNLFSEAGGLVNQLESF